MLQARGYVYILDERKRVYPTKRLFTITQQIAHYDPVLETIGPVLAALQQACGDTVILGKRQGLGISDLDVLESRQTVRYAACPGDTKPLYSSAICKAMLGALPEPEMERLVKRLPLPAVTPHTIGSVWATSATAWLLPGRSGGWTRTTKPPWQHCWRLARSFAASTRSCAAGVESGRGSSHPMCAPPLIRDVGRSCRTQRPTAGKRWAWPPRPS